jgi:ribose transport system ATP-binding protein
MTSSPVLEIEHLSKTFPGQLALDDVSLELRAGEVHGLVGQNGAGKSTLIKVLAGFHDPDPGALFRLGGANYEPRNRAGAGGARIGFVHQDLALVPTLSAAENIALTRGFETGRGGNIRWRLVNERAQKLIEPFGVDIDVRETVARLAPVERAIVAMARATQGALEDTALLVLDEPTAALPAPEVDRLLTAIRRFAGSGGGVLYVSHRLDELFAVADRVTVLRNGRKVTTELVAHLDHATLVSHMLGQGVQALQKVPAAPAGGEACLQVDGLSGGRVRGVSFSLRRGEVLGVAGIVGSGREHLASLLFGAVKPRAGTILVDGERLDSGSPRDSLSCGMAFVPAERAREGLVMTHVVRENMLLPRLDDFVKPYGVDRSREREETHGWIDRLGIDPPNSERQVNLLSGGNQQKVVFARGLGLGPKILVLDEPGQGIDVGARRRILELVAEASRSGVGVVFCTSEVEDLPAVCHRVLVLREGLVARELSGSAISEHTVLEASLGVAA